MASELPITLMSTVIAYYKAHTTFNAPDRFGDRVSVRQHYGDQTWDKGKPGLTIRLDGGAPAQQLLEQRGRLECRVYAPRATDCDVLFALMEKDLQQFQKTVVNHEAVLQFMVLESQASYLQDPDTNLPMYLFFISASVRTTSVLEEA